MWGDPGGGRMVLWSGLAGEMGGWQLCRGGAVLDQYDIERVLALKNSVAEFAVRCNSTAVDAFFKQTGQRGMSLPDPVAMGIALNPPLCTSSTHHYAQIEPPTDPTRPITLLILL